MSHGSKGAAAEWATRFNRMESEFDHAADQGRAYTRGPSAVLAASGRAAQRPGGGLRTRALAEVAIAAASLGDLSISALGTATVLGNAQLVAAGMQPPSPADFAAGLVRAADPTPTPTPTPTPVPGRLSGAENDPSQTPPPTLDELLAELDALVGLDAVKSEVRHQTQVLRIEGLRRTAGLKVPDMTRHLVFVGNPGTGKTTVARLVAGIYRASGVLPKGHLVECDRSSLVAGYLGQTAIKTTEMIDKALGGALFVDEAYALAGDEYGAEAIDTLVKAMEDHRDELLVIIAGYPGPMTLLISTNPGLESRFRLTLEFDDYSDDELVDIFCRLAAASDFTPTERYRDATADDPFGDAARRRIRERAVRANDVRVGGGAASVAIARHRAPDVTQLRELTPEDLDDGPAEHAAGSSDRRATGERGLTWRRQLLPRTTVPGTTTSAAPARDSPVARAAGRSVLGHARPDAHPRGAVRRRVRALRRVGVRYRRAPAFATEPSARPRSTTRPGAGHPHQPRPGRRQRDERVPRRRAREHRRARRLHRRHRGRVGHDRAGRECRTERRRSSSRRSTRS